MRKHRELIPSIFVSFHTLPTASTPEDLRTADEGLIKTVGERRRALTERGIKLTVVLLTEREMLDDTQLEGRLSFIRRSSGLDSRASLFVLTPVSRGELGEFVGSLHSALFEPAADYYREHARRVKRKRTRYPPPSSTLQPIANAISTLPSPSTSPNTKPVGLNDIPWLSREGWMLRSEYKLAVFAELSSDIPEALLRYREAYDLLCTSPTALLGSTLVLPPRTKRWAEAKVLADTLAIRICKLLLYSDDGEGAALFFRRHLVRFTELSTGWGIGTSTFEYWSWLSKQYRLFGELLEHATRQVPNAPLPPFALPIHAPPLPSKLLHPEARAGAGGEGMLLPNSNAVAVSILPYSTLQTPAAYYYLAALCTIERRTRFIRASSDPSNIAASEDSSPLAHENKVDHTAQLTESLTKSYEAFKRARLHRSALFVAARIATAYHEGGQNGIALKFLERILKNYKKEEVEDVRAGLVEIAIEAAVKEGDIRVMVKMLIEVVDGKLPMERGRREGLVEAVKRVFLQQGEKKEEVEGGEKKQGEGEGKEGVVGSVTAGFVSMETVWPAAEVEFEAEVPFQLVLRNTSAFDLTDVLTVEKAVIEIQNGDETFTVAVESSGSSDSLIVNLGCINSTRTTTHTANLSSIFTSHGVLALQANLNATHPGTTRIINIILHIRTNTPDKLGLQLDLQLPTPDHPTEASRWILPSGRTVPIAQRPDPSSTLVRAKSFNVSLSVTASVEVGYVDEIIPLTITLVNNEKAAIQGWIDATLQPSYDGALDSLGPNPDEEVGGVGKKVERLATGRIEAGAKGEVTIWLRGRQGAGLRTVDVSLRVAASDAGQVEGEREVEVEGMPVTATTSIAVPITMLVDPKTWTHAVKSVQEGRRERVKALLNFDDQPETQTEVEEQTKVGLEITMVGETPVHVSSIDLLSNGKPLISNDDKANQEALGEWIVDDRFSFSNIIPSTTTNLGWRLIWSRVPSSIPHTTIIPFSLPPSTSSLRTTNQTDLTLTLTHSPSASLHQPFDLSLTLTNHHPTRSYKLVLTLDSDPYFTIAGTRRLSIPFLLPGQTREWGCLARLVPQSVGRLKVPNVGVRVMDPQGAAGEGTTLALMNSHDVKKEREEEGGGWEDVVKFQWTSGDGKVVVRL